MSIPETSGWIHAGGDRLETRQWHVPNAPGTLVLLHEGLGSAGLWRGFPLSLAKATGWRVFAWSRAGYGRSDPCPLPRPLDYMSREATLLPEILSAAEIGRHVLIGHSDGSTIAALHAATPSPDLAAVVLIAPHFFVEDVSIEAIAAAGEAYRTGDLKARLARHHDHADVAFYGWHDAWLAPGFRNWNVMDCVGGWQAPVLALQGTGDPYGTPAQVDVLRRATADCRVHLLDGLGHAPHLEAPERCLPLIRDFMADLPA